MEPGNLIWLALGLAFSILIAVPFVLQRRYEERLYALREALADSRKNENVATICLAYEKRNREHAEALAKACRDELERDSSLVDALKALGAELREADEGRHREVLALAQTILAKADFVANSVFTRQTELESAAQFGAKAILKRRDALLDENNIVLASTLGSLITARNYLNLGLHRQLEYANERLAKDGALDLEVLEPVKKRPKSKGKVVPFPKPVQPEGDEAPPSTSPSPVSG